MGCCCSSENNDQSKKDAYSRKKGLSDSGGYNRVNLRKRGSDKEKSQGKKGVFVAIWDYDKSSGAELSFRKGEIFKEVGDECDAGPEWLFVIREKKPDQKGGGRKSAGMGATGYVPRNYVAPVGSLEAQPFWFGDISRLDSELLLRGTPDGTFVVRGREGDVKPQMALSVSHGGRVKHYRIHASEVRRREKRYAIGITQFPSLIDLVQHFRVNEGGGICCILTNSPSKPPPPRTTLSAEIEKHWREIPRPQISIETEIGKGFYGIVYKGTWEPKKGMKLQVAVKELKRGLAGQEEFLYEAIAMKNLRHEHLVKLLGVVSADEPFYIVTEFIKEGSLRSYLRKRAKEKRLLSEAQLVDISRQVADGMYFLQKKGVVHRDLAARNVLIEEIDHSTSEKPSSAQQFNVKIADFGLAKLIKSGRSMREEKALSLPTKWTAPEALTHGTFSRASDVWSFGILLHEIFTHGREPYEGMTTEQTRVFVLEERRQMPRAPEMPEKIYELLAQCCDHNENGRPDFHSILLFFENYYEAERHYDQYLKPRHL